MQEKVAHLQREVWLSFIISRPGKENLPGLSSLTFPGTHCIQRIPFFGSYEQMKKKLFSFFSHNPSLPYPKMGKTKVTKKFAMVKRMITPKDARLAENKKKLELETKKKEEQKVRHVPQTNSSLFFAYNKCMSVCVASSLLFSSFSLGPAISCYRRYKFHKFQLAKQVGDGTGNDGLSVCKVCSLHQRLCHGRT